MYTDDEDLYLSRINAAYTGCILSCNPYIKEYKDFFPFHDSSLSEFILAVPGIVFNIPVTVLKVIYEFLLPFLLSLLIYWLIFRLTKNTWFSILGSIFIILGFNLINSVDLINILDIFHLFRLENNHTQFLIFSRPVNPQFSSIFFFIYLHVLFSAVTKKTYNWFILLALTYGFSFYIYFFTYTFITIIQGVWVVICLLKREWKTFNCFCITTVVGLAIATPHLIEIFRLFQHPYYSTIPTGFLISTHIPDISLLGVMLFLIFIVIIILYIKRFKIITMSAYFIGSLILACFITRNEHIISGMIMQYDHFENYLFSPILVIALCFCLHAFINNIHQKRFYWLIALVSFVPIINACIIQYDFYHFWLYRAINDQKYVPVLEWLKAKIPANVVVYAPESLSALIPIYTHDYVIWSAHAYQWVSVPGRMQDILSSRTSASKFEESTKKYGVDYYIEEKKKDLFLRDKVKKERIYEDEDFVVYKASQ